MTGHPYFRSIKKRYLKIPRDAKEKIKKALEMLFRGPKSG
jgi:hypothetical protein